MHYQNLSLTDIEGEIWKPIAGHERYEVSSKGRVKSLQNEYDQFVDGVFYKRNVNPPIIRKQIVNTRGYLSVSLSKNSKTTYHRINRLVAQAFIPNPENKSTVNHKDGVKANNCVENLEWNTQGENNDHALKTGLRKNIGERVHFAKLKKEQVVSVFLENGTDTDIGRKYGIPRTTVIHIRKGETWKSVTQNLVRI